MRVISYQRYGGAEVLGLETRAAPVPKADEVLIRIHATTVTSGDRSARSLDLPRGYGAIGRLVFGVLGPRRSVLGTELAGVVEVIGQSVTEFSVGDRVCAYRGAKFGGYADYAVVHKDSALLQIPETITFEQAASMSFGGCTALKFLRDIGKVKAGDEVLVQGAAGGVGSACVQIARHFGATVTGLCRRENIDMVKALGAHHAIESTRENIEALSHRYDIIIDTSGSMSYRQAEPLLNYCGRLLLVSADLPQTLAMYMTPKRDGKKGLIGYAGELVADMKVLMQLVSDDDYQPWIDRRYSLLELPQAHADYDRDGKRGNWVINVISP